LIKTVNNNTKKRLIRTINENLIIIKSVTVNHKYIK